MGLARMGIRSKLTLALGATAFLSCCMASVALFVVERLSLESRARQIMEPYAQLVSVGAETAVAFQDPARAGEILGTLRAHPQMLYAQILLRDGRNLASYQNHAEAPYSREADDLRQAEGVYLAQESAELVKPLQEGATLRLVMSLDALKRESRRFIMMATGALLVLLGALTFGLREALQRFLVQPLVSLAAMAERVRIGGDYCQRVSTKGEDELAQLGRNFNAMMEVIQGREADLQRSNLFQKAILENVAYGIVSATPDGRISSFNRAAERLLGYSAGEVIGKEIFWHDREEIAGRARKLTEQLGEPVAADFAVFVARPRRNLPDEREWNIIRRDGSRLPILLSVTALRSDDNSITGYVGLMYDLTDRKRAEGEIHRLNAELERRVVERTAQLEAANAELESFSYSVSHDLRAPLRHIDGFGQLLRSSCQDSLSKDGLHYLDLISGSIGRMGELIDDLLHFSRTSRAEMRLQALDMNVPLDEALRPLKDSCNSRNIDWIVPPMPKVLGDASLLRQVWTNLIENAVKYTRTRAQARIEISSREEGDELVFVVADNGVGFDMRYAHKLFGVFQRLHAQDQFEGTGIGLATVQRIVKRHGGRVWAESELDKGSRFCFSLPKARPTT